MAKMNHFNTKLAVSYPWAFLHTPVGMSLKLKNGKQVKIYFAHAYHSWERGSNENYNRMIRRYFLKGTDFTK